MKNKKLILGTVGALSVLIIALVVIPGFIDWSKYQSLAQQKLREATGYELSIGGALRISLLPSPHASVHNVVVKKPASSEAFLTFEDANVSLALFPLLSGRVEISSVTLDKPVLTMVTGKDGTDNWKPQTAAETPAVDAVTGAPVAEKQGPAISISGLKIKDGKVILRDEAKGIVREVGINDLSVKADTLTGPFDGDGTISYGKGVFDVSVTTGGYRKGETLPVQLNVSDKASRASVKWSGVVATGDATEMQGEMDLSFTDIASVMADVGMPVAWPFPNAKTRISGMVTAKPDGVTLTNGALELGNTRMAAKLAVSGLTAGPKVINATIDAKDLIDLDSVIDVANKAVEKSDAASGKDSKSSSQAASNTAPLVPETFELPKDLKADIQLRGKGFDYKKQKTGAFEIRATVADGKGDLHTTLAALPGGGDISVSASMATKGAIEGSAQVSIASLKNVFSDWLDLVDASTFDNPSLPRRIDTAVTFKVAGRTATVAVNPLSLGETKLNGTIAYTVGARPLLTAVLAGNVWTMPAPEKPKAEEGDKADAKKAEAKPAKVDFTFDPPQLPFDLKFDIALARLTRGDLLLTDVKAAGTYNGKSLKLTQGQANVSGGTVKLTGTVADLKALSGMDVQAGLATSDLESFAQAMTGKPLALSKKIGNFNGSVKAKGDKSKLNVDASAQALGFTVLASGDMNDPFSSELPSSINMRLKHANFVDAVRVFSPGFGNAGDVAAKPVDVAGLVKITGKVYEISGLKGVVGNSDFAGSLKADLSGSVPSYTATLNSTKLDAGALVGVGSKDASKGGGASSTQGGGAAPSGMTPWSREPLDTAFLSAMNLDMKFSAGTLLYGTWALKDANAEVKLKNGSLKASPISGKLYDGSFDATLSATSAGSKSPLSFDFSADVDKVAIGPFLQALMSSSKKMADGTGSLKLAMQGTGMSSAALMESLSGKADIDAKSAVIYGMDIDKLAANMVEAFDGGWKGVLAGFAMQGFSGGSTAFNDIAHSFPIKGGEMEVKDFKLETTKSNAIINSNGGVSFNRWYMDVQNDVKVTQPKDTPVIGLRIFGPLSDPQKTVNSQALDNLIRSKVGDKLQDALGDKLKDSKAGAIINQFLGGGQQQQAPVPAPVQQAPTGTDTAPVPAPEAQPQTQQQPEATPQQQLLNGLINQLAR